MSRQTRVILQRSAKVNTLVVQLQGNTRQRSLKLLNSHLQMYQQKQNTAYKYHVLTAIKPIVLHCVSFVLCVK